MPPYGQYGPVSGQRGLLGENDTFCFDCHPGVSCFTRCCRDADMVLYPYDIIRLKRHLAMDSDTFLSRHTVTAFRDNPHFPSVMLKMSDQPDRACAFLTDAGCTVYPDRPFSCRAYPVERAVGRRGPGGRRPVYYQIARHDHCRGHAEERRWTIAQWMEDQQVAPFNEMNDRWVDVDTLLRSNPWGAQGIQSPALKMAFMACFNVDRFRSFVFESTFLSRFDISGDTIEALRSSDTTLMCFGFDWVRYFLSGAGPLKPR